jgi:hypothetical protein
VVTWGETMLLVVDEIACIVSNKRVLNEIQDSPGGSPASWVFPYILKSPRCVCRRVI